MELSEKIIYCRKKAGLSQLDLADKLGVSRQSVSKWETGESNPDVTKIPLLAKEFGISADWLLSEDEPEEPQTADTPQTAPTPYPDWIEQLPSHLGKMVKKFGWLYGVRVAVGGGIITLFGCLSRAMFRSMLQPVSPFAGIIPGTDFGITDPSTDFSFAGSAYSHQVFSNPIFSDFNSTAWRTASLFTGGIIAIGVVMAVAGILLAIALKKWGSEEH